MSDWELFLREVSWFLQPGESAVAGEAQPWTRGPAEALPELSALLEATTLTPVTVGGTPYELLAWGPPDGRRGWLCHAPGHVDGGPFPKAHKSFWKLCGGIVERFGEPTTWWENQNEVLTAEAAHVRVADVLADYAWLWEGEGLAIPIDPDEYYTVAVEANGNLTLAHRDNGRLLLFAPDHAFKGVAPLDGCPPYSLLTIDNVPDLATWIEVCAAAWRGQ
ncbi:hypothetical protein [Actinomadura bangladeshensis]|uniref:Uncharacterized protein n=1 Tax=Actinomadura bangladeshensis TaxID=453573 RepID=A0A6L9QUC4_9ACTN|nr:hypothetical protein [Actinomadura bangladeshensis]NEA28718.1 hypothetical protein [Actinomadura bangladeshensis]